MRLVRNTALLATAALAALAAPAFADSYFFRSKPVVDVSQPFAFPGVANAAPGNAVESAVVRLSGFRGRTASVAGGQYQICSLADCSDQASWRTAATEGLPDQAYARVRVTAAGYGQSVSARLLVGDTAAEFVAGSRGKDTQPDGFTFGSKSGQEPGAYAFSDPVVLAGFDGAPLAVSGGGYQVCAASDCSDRNGHPVLTAAVSDIAAGTRVRLAAMPSAFGTTSTATLTVGGVSGSFSAVARAKDETPDTVQFVAKSDQTVGADVLSETVQLTNHDGVTVSVTNATLRVCSDSGCASTSTGWVMSATAPKNAWLQLKQVAPAAGQTQVAGLSYGTVATNWSVGSKSAPVSCVGTPGGTCADGSIFVTNYNGANLYVAASNSGFIQFKGSQTASSGAASYTDGISNTNSLVNQGGHPAAVYCRNMGSGWYLPSINELELAWNALHPSGTMPTAHYISSTTTGTTTAWRKSYADGQRQEAQKDWPYHTARCMKRQ